MSTACCIVYVYCYKCNWNGDMEFEECRVGKINSKLGKEFVIQHHYSHGIHNGPMCYGMYEKDILVGVCAFATPCSENVRSSVFGKQYKNRVTELHRLVLLDRMPHNSESWFISRSLKLLKINKPDLWGILSFADQTQGHVGTIYQACNAIYTGTSNKATFYIDIDGRLRHPRQNGINITSSKARQLGWIPTKREGKHRYLFLTPTDKRELRDMEEKLLLESLPYPKQIT